MIDKVKSVLVNLKEGISGFFAMVFGKIIAFIPEGLRERVSDLFTLPRLRCKCGEVDDIHQSQRNKIERAVGFVIPFRTYRCGECDRRFWHFIRPLFNWSRGLTASLVTLVMLWLVAGILFPPKPVVAETLAQSEIAAETTDETLVGPAEQGDESAAMAANGQSEVAAAPEMSAPPIREDLRPPSTIDHQSVAASRGELVIEDEEETAVSSEYSDRVMAQAARNQQTRGLPAKVENTVKRANLPTPQVPPSIKRQESPAVSGSLVFQNLSADVQSGVLTVSLAYSGELGQHNSFAIGDDRYVVDLPGSWRGQVPKQLAVTHDSVARIRTGSHPDYLRLVFDLKNSAVPQVIKVDGAVRINFPGQ